MRQFRLAAVVTLSSVAAHPVVAQASSGPRVGLSQLSRVATPTWDRSFRRDSVPRNQWERGALIGAGIGAALGLAAFAFEHSYNETRTSGFVIVGPTLVFALIGGLSGSGSHRT